MPTTSFTKRTRDILHVPAAIRNELASFDIAMKLLCGQSTTRVTMPVLHGVEMNVIDMSLEIGFIANGMLPIAALPDPFFSLGKLAFRSWPRFETARKATLN